MPYWDERCGLKFSGIEDFGIRLTKFLAKRDDFNPAAYIQENLTLEKGAEKYLDIYTQVLNELN